jgi:hypothetical protein
MAFKMKGSPAKLGTIQGTAGHSSALKQQKSIFKIENEKRQKEKEEKEKRDKRIEDKEKMFERDERDLRPDLNPGPRYGNSPAKQKQQSSGKINAGEMQTSDLGKKLRKLKQIKAEQDFMGKKNWTENEIIKMSPEKRKKFMDALKKHVSNMSPAKQKVDPDAPGTPGEPGYEPPVRREDLDAEGKAIWDKLREQGVDEVIPSKKDVKKKKIHDLLKDPIPGKKKKSPAKQEGPVDKKQLPLQEGEMEGTNVYDPSEDKTENKRFVRNERINDLEDRAEFAMSDAENSEGEEKKKHLANAKKLQHEANILRNRKPN